MRLAQYLMEKRLSEAALGAEIEAAAVGLGAPVRAPQQKVNGWKRSDRAPAPAVMRAIYVATRGQVRPDDFYELPELPPPSADSESRGEAA